MPLLSIAICGFILAFEIAAWLLFRRKVAGLTIDGPDSSSIPFFTLQRLRVIGIVHTVTMLAIVIAIFSLLW
ncbi:MAG: hypothetical protein G01um101425_172 [Candidatus Peregrinibacteria bacterium Gr01-1014_25]|nr:MAG: hypothetical protein G01um101425_172 [Candidatus Peregrinibacteria bacterium Gr01-1014_25]